MPGDKTLYVMHVLECVSVADATIDDLLSLPRQIFEAYIQA